MYTHACIYEHFFFFKVTLHSLQRTILERDLCDSPLFVFIALNVPLLRECTWVSAGTPTAPQAPARRSR